MTIVFKVSEKLKEKMVEYYQDKRREKTPPYAVFQAMDADTIVISADIDANMWVEMEKKLTGIKINLNEEKEKKAKTEKVRNELYNIDTIGSDEVGTGDYFGPIVVTATFIPLKQIPLMESLGVRDSKLITDEKILQIAPTLMKEVSYATFILSPKEYNDYQAKGYNMNKIKAILHNKVLYEMKQKYPKDYKKIIIDQFVYPQKYYEHIQNEKEKVTNISFYTKAESICPSVAAASCISRYIFLQKMD